MGNLTPPSNRVIKGKNTTWGRRSRAMLSSWQYDISTSSGIANLALKLAKAASVSRRWANPILYYGIETEKKNESKERKEVSKETYCGL